jgi:hypothetical protein
MFNRKQLILDITLALLIPLSFYSIANRFDALGPFEMFVAFYTGPVYVFLILATALTNAIASPANIEPTSFQMTTLLVTAILVRLGIGLWMNHLLRNSRQSLAVVKTVAISLLFLLVGCLYIGGSQQ